MLTLKEFQNIFKNTPKLHYLIVLNTIIKPNPLNSDETLSSEDLWKLGLQIPKHIVLSMRFKDYFPSWEEILYDSSYRSDSDELRKIVFCSESFDGTLQDLIRNPKSFYEFINRRKLEVTIFVHTTDGFSIFDRPENEEICRYFVEKDFSKTELIFKSKTNARLLIRFIRKL